jgi:hypothetical protein
VLGGSSSSGGASRGSAALLLLALPPLDVAPARAAAATLAAACSHTRFCSRSSCSSRCIASIVSFLRRRVSLACLRLRARLPKRRWGLKHSLNERQRAVAVSVELGYALSRYNFLLFLTGNCRSSVVSFCCYR